FDHHKAERLGPVDGKQESQSVAEEFTLFLVADLADEFDQWMIEQRLDDALEIFPIGRIHLGRYFQRNSGALGDLNGAVRPLFRRDAAEKSQIATASHSEGKKRRRQSVVDRRQPIDDRRQRPALAVRNGNERHLRKDAIDRMKIRQIEAAVQSRDAFIEKMFEHRKLEQV